MENGPISPTKYYDLIPRATLTTTIIGKEFIVGKISKPIIDEIILSLQGGMGKILSAWGLSEHLTGIWEQWPLMSL